MLYSKAIGCKIGDVDLKLSCQTYFWFPSRWRQEGWQNLLLGNANQTYSLNNTIYSTVDYVSGVFLLRLETDAASEWAWPTTDLHDAQSHNKYQEW